MKWKGREGSGNVEDRRGMRPGRIAVGGGIGTIVILIIFLLMGGILLNCLTQCRREIQGQNLVR